MKRKRLQIMLAGLAMLLCCAASMSYAFALPDTGQTKCYDGNGNVVACSGTGQDGAHIVNPMSYTDNGDGTITDNNTGLMWQTQDDGATRDWSDAGTYCTNLSVGGHSDWRLPAVLELMGIVNYGIAWPGPMINTTYFPNTNADNGTGYWSSTPDAYNTTPGSVTYYAWYVSFRDGSVSYSGYKPSVAGYARCVRGSQESLSLTDNGNGTVTDSGTGLMWQQAEGGSMYWWNALSYCLGLNLGGQSDWRLPNVKELESIIDFTRDGPAINTAFFPEAQNFAYWSSTKDAYALYSPWYVHFTYGYAYYKNLNDYSIYDYPDVRCVRDGQSGSSGSIVHTLTGPATTTVSRGGTLGPIASSITNNTTSGYTGYLMAIFYTPKGSWVNSVSWPLTLSAGQKVSNNNISLPIPSLADTGPYQFCEYLYDTSWSEIDHKCVNFTVQ